MESREFRRDPAAVLRSFSLYQVTFTRLAAPDAPHGSGEHFCVRCPQLAAIVYGLRTSVKIFYALLNKFPVRFGVSKDTILGGGAGRDDFPAPVRLLGGRRSRWR